MERYDEALVDIEESLELMSTSFKAYRTRARIHLHLESYDKAVADFKSAIQQAQSDGNSTDADIRALKAELKKAETAFEAEQDEGLLQDPRRPARMFNSRHQKGLQKRESQAPS